MKLELKYIGKQITIKALKDFIIDNGDLDEKVILLNSQNFDDIVLEYLEFYKESMPIPYNLLGVLITEDETNKVPLNRIGIDISENHIIYEVSNDERYNLYDGEFAYRCGFCGGIIDKNGNELYDEERQRIINYIENYEKPIVNHAYGKCCQNEW
ncbi:hypothetical protein N5J53_16275 [Empedobacter sp. GD03644]|uniref:hypothetical protein n=1 Tax=Empedobacter sp. GD03644 TaxID=2975358 RepID=UPI00244D4FFA|nr:hypothetical protein [Empedobacter sp. GD03644]MDH2208566.1 hypothetical protein [Empedobacter sp. GD03644]